VLTTGSIVVRPPKKKKEKENGHRMISESRGGIKVFEENF
jgi:hypothetical protein